MSHKGNFLSRVAGIFFFLIPEEKCQETVAKEDESGQVILMSNLALLWQKLRWWYVLWSL